ncbi:MAG: class I SAM-dependent methyltransferase, partial [Anaerolineales bacterium]
RYSVWLAQRGYRVVLADLSPTLLDIARARLAEAGVLSHIEAVVTCDACDLSRFEANSFDAVLCLGPFYHLVEAVDRERAAGELVRVLRPKGTAFVAFMPIYTFLRRNPGGVFIFACCGGPRACPAQGAASFPVAPGVQRGRPGVAPSEQCRTRKVENFHERLNSNPSSIQTGWF